MDTRPYTWKHRSKEWVKENPGKGTMYKEYLGPEPEPKKNKPIDLKPIQKTINKAISTPKRNGIKESIGSKEKIPQGIIGIYAIVCEKEKCVYVGQSKNIAVRLRSHKMTIASDDPYYDTKVYKQMREHRKKHGADVFNFLVYKILNGAETKELLSEENNAMIYYASNGYKLYNSSLCTELVNSMIMCPEQFKQIILNTIDKLATKTDFESRLKTLLDE